MVVSSRNEQETHSVSVRCTLNSRLYYLAREHSVSLNEALIRGLQFFLENPAEPTTNSHERVITFPPPRGDGNVITMVNNPKQSLAIRRLTMDSTQYPLGLRHSFY